MNRSWRCVADFVPLKKINAMLEIEKWFNPTWLTFIIFHHHFVYLIIEKFVFQVELVVWSGVSPRFFWLSRWTCSYDDLPTWVTRCAPLYVTVHLDGFPVTKRNVRLGGEGLKSEDIVATTSRDSYTAMPPWSIECLDNCETMFFLLQIFGSFLFAL